MKQQGEMRSCLIYLPKDKDKVIIGGIKGETKKEYIERLIKTYNRYPLKEIKQSQVDKAKQREVYIKKEKLRNKIDILIEYNTNKFRESKPSKQIIDFIKEWKESEQELRDMFGYKECIYTRNSRSKGLCPPKNISMVRCSVCKLSE